LIDGPREFSPKCPDWFFDRWAKRILSKMSRLVLVSSQASIQWIPEVLFFSWKEEWLGVKLATHLPLVLR
jgi:hypothetical protein